MTNPSENAAKTLGQVLVSQRLTLATAESLTGGLLGGKVTDVAGASKYYLGGVISYTNSAKANVIHVDDDLLSNYGAVSEPVVRAMAHGVRLLFGADIGLATSGVAGPDTQEEKLAGTLCIGISMVDGNQSTTERLAAEGRHQVRAKSVDRAITYLLMSLTNGQYEEMTFPYK